VKPVFKEIPQGQERAPQSSEPPFKEKEKGGGRLPCLVVKGGSHAWWSMKIPCLVVNEDPLLGGQRRSLAWWSMKIPCLVVNEGSHAWWSMGGEEEGSLLPIPTSP
jgi:hypothetical protein